MPAPGNCVFWGSAGHARVLAGVVTAHGGQVLALFDNAATVSVLPGVPLFIGREGFLRWAASRTDLARIHAFAAIGGARGEDRLALQDFMAAAGLGLSVLVHPQATVAADARLGAGSQVLAQAVVAEGAVLGRACIVNHRAGVDHECVLGDGVHIAPGATLCGCVQVGRNVLVGAGAVVLPRIRIGDNAVVGAGAVVTRDVPDGVTVLGRPAMPR